MSKPDDTIRVLIPLKVRKKNGRPKIQGLGCLQAHKFGQSISPFQKHLIGPERCF